MKSAVFLLCVFLIATTANAQGHNGNVNKECVAAHCASEFAACEKDANCMKIVKCIEGCFGKWSQDNTPQKLMVQNCTSVCAFSYANTVYTDFMACVGTHKCLSLPAVPKICKNPTISKKVPPSNLKGTWWVVRGYNPVYNCYPCQQSTYDENNSTTWKYSPKYKTYLVDGSLKMIEQSGYLTNTTTAQDGYAVTLDDAGATLSETFWVIDAADDAHYVVMYMCGSLLEWNFEGAMVYSKSPMLSDDDVKAITASYKSAVGLDFSEFCKPDVSNCS